VFADFHVECRQALDSTFALKTSESQTKSANVGKKTRAFSIMGPDCADILERFTQLTQEHQMDVIDLDSEVVSGTHVGYDIFNAQVTVSVPHGQDLDSVFAQRLGNELGVELTLSNE
jgi:glycine cleavage system regulatory protein